MKVLNAGSAAGGIVSLRSEEKQAVSICWEHVPDIQLYAAPSL